MNQKRFYDEPIFMKDIVLVEHLEDVDLGVQEVGGYKCNVVHSTLTMLEIHA